MVQHQRNGLSEKKAQSHQNQQVHDRLVNILTVFVPSFTIFVPSFTDVHDRLVNTLTVFVPSLAFH